MKRGKHIRGNLRRQAPYDLGISSRTLEVYRANVMTKFEVGNFADALRVAFAAGMGSEKQWRETYNVGGAKPMQTLE